MPDVFEFLQRHWELSFAFGVVMVLLFIVEFIRQKRGTQQLSPLQLTHMINHQSAVVVDLRPADAFAKGHIIGAMSIPLSEFKDKSKKIEKLKSQPIVLVCAKGIESPKTAVVLHKKGLDVHILRGGISSWIGADMPVVKTKKR